MFGFHFMMAFNDADNVKLFWGINCDGQNIIRQQ